MPHEPWIYLPSGRQSRPAGKDPVEGINKLPGFDDPDLSLHNHLRHLLQVGYTDHQIGELLARLRRTGLLERALIVVTADHGYSFQVGVRSRRLLSEGNVEEIAPVPFFVKAPGQTEGRVDEGLVRNVDIVATIADLLDTSVFWKQDGHSAFSAATRARREFAVNTRDFAQVVRIGLPEMERRRATWRRRWARLFGTGIESQVLYGDPWAMAYRIGPRPELLGRRVSALRVQTSSIRAAVANAALFRDVSGSAKFFPTRVTGPLTGVPFGEHRDVAVAVNGRIRAVGPELRPLVEGPRVLLADGPGVGAARRAQPHRCVRGAAVRRARPAAAPVDRVRLGAAVHVDVRRVLARVDEGAEVALAVIARDAGAEELIAELDRVRSLEVADQLGVPPARMNARNAFALRSVVLVSETTVGRAARPAATTPTTVASSRPVPIAVDQHLELRRRRSARLGGGTTPPGPARQPWRDDGDDGQVGEGRDQDRRDQVDPGADRRQQVQDQAVEQRDRDEGGPHPRPAQPPADAGGPKALVSIHCTGE